MALFTLRVIIASPGSIAVQGFRQTRSVISPCKEKIMLSESSLLVLHEVYAHLLSLLAHAKAYCGESVVAVAMLFSLLVNAACSKRIH